VIRFVIGFLVARVLVLACGDAPTSWHANNGDTWYAACGDEDGNETRSVAFTVGAPW
jgi:hypothetical protein